MTLEQAKVILNQRGVDYSAMPPASIIQMASGLAGGPTSPLMGPSLPFQVGQPFVTLSMRKYVEALRQSNFNNLSSSGAGPNAYVFMGGKTVPNIPVDWNPTVGTSIPEQLDRLDKKRNRDFQSVGGLMQEFEAKSVEEKQELGKLLFMAGYLNASGSSPADAFKGTTLMEIQSAYGDLLADAAGRFASGQNITPDQLLEMNIKFNLSQAGVDTEGQGLKNASSWWNQLNHIAEGDPNDPNSPNFTGTKTQTQKHTDIYSPEDTQALVKAVLQQEMGRDPTRAEMEDFAAALTSAMRSNPSVSKTTQTYDKGQLVSSNTTTHEGIGAAGLQNLAEEKAQAQPGYAEWQAVGTYLPRLFQELGSAVPGT